MARKTWFYPPLVLMLLLFSLLSSACGTLEVGVEPTSASRTPAPAAPTATPTAAYEVPPADLCQGYLELLVSAEELEERAVVTSYRCGNAWIDSTGQSPARSPTLTLGPGRSIHLQLTAQEQPIAVDLRLYPGAGVAASYLKWPEELPSQVEPVDQFLPEPNADLHYLVQAEPGTYSLVCRATWEGDIDVFYAISFNLEDAK